MPRECPVRRSLRVVPKLPPISKAPKNGKTRRVDLPRIVAVPLDACRPASADPEGFIFRNRHGSYLRPSWVTITLNPVGRTVHPRLRFHDLRHTCAALSSDLAEACGECHVVPMEEPGVDRA
jgi:integrase